MQDPVLKAECQALTAFYSEADGKRYCFMRCPQGLKNSPLHLKLLLDELLGDMAQDIIHYADDIMIATDGSFEDHMEKVGQVLGRLKKGNIKIRPLKISVAKPTVDFLGVVWQKGKISIPKAKLLAFIELLSPNRPKKTKGVVAMMVYYQKLIPHYAHLAKPVGNLALAHPKQFKWTNEHKTCYWYIIEHVKKQVMLHLPDPTKPYYVQTEASNSCGAGRVFQIDEEGDEKILACVSKTFTKTEPAYSTGPSIAIHPQNNGLLSQICSQNHHSC
jgi:hypothetical protein